MNLKNNVFYWKWKITIRWWSSKRDEAFEAGWELFWRQISDFREKLKRYLLAIKYFYVLYDLIDSTGTMVSFVVPQGVPQKSKTAYKMHF